MTSHRRSGHTPTRVSLLTLLRQLVYRPRHRGRYRPQHNWATRWKTVEDGCLRQPVHDTAGEAVLSWRDATRATGPTHLRGCPVNLYDADGLSYDEGLFAVAENPKTKAPPPDRRPSRTAAEHRKVARRIGNGTHPLGHPIYLHPEAPRDLDAAEAKVSKSTGPRCGTCVFRRKGGTGGNYPKCHLPTRIGDREVFPRISGSETSDVAAWWPACTDYEGRSQ